MALVVALGVGDDPAPEAGPPQAGTVQVVELDPLTDSPMAVTADLRSVAWGTRIELECTYAAAGPDTGDAASPYVGQPSYVLVVSDSIGQTERVASWSAVPGRVVTVQGATALRLEVITRLEVRSSDGTPLLRADR